MRTYIVETTSWRVEYGGMMMAERWDGDKLRNGEGRGKREESKCCFSPVVPLASLYNISIQFLTNRTFYLRYMPGKSGVSAQEWDEQCQGEFTHRLRAIRRISAMPFLLSLQNIIHQFLMASRIGSVQKWSLVERNIFVVLPWRHRDHIDTISQCTPCYST